MHAGRVLIVGDGPAGCAAAIAAARAGGDVAMLGRGRSCAAPECASGMTLKLLERVAPRVAGQPATWLDAEADARGGRAVMRGRFDDGLRAAAVAAGVHYSRARDGMLVPRVEHGGVVGVTHRDGACDASIVIDASGIDGWLRRALRLDEVTDSAPFWLRRGYARAERSHGGARWQITRDGWLWVKATSAHAVWTSLSATRDDSVPWPADASPVGRVWRECRRWRCLRQAAGPGYFVCGDAARFLDPATGDGLRFAIDSGMRAGALAAETIRHPHRSNVLAALYADWVVQGYEGDKAVLARSYADAGLEIGWRDRDRRRDSSSPVRLS